MSSVKKQIHFVPKVARRKPIRSTDTKKDSDLATPETVLFYDKSAKQSQTPGDEVPQEQEENVDPKDASKQLQQEQQQQLEEQQQQEEQSAVADEDESEDYGDNDIFTKQLPTKVRQYSTSRRRLSGIFNKPVSRSSSITSATPGAGAVPESHKPKAIPVVIEDPKARSKRRRSVVRRPSKRISVSAAPSGAAGITVSEEVGSRDATHDDEAIIDEEDGPQDEDENNGNNGPETSVMVTETLRSRDELYEQDQHVIYALDPETDVLTQYRTGELLEEDIEKYKLNPRTVKTLKLAPEKVNMTVTRIEQLPKNINYIQPKLLYLVEINPENMSMKDLCRLNLPVGKVSENIEKVHIAKQRRREAKQLRKDSRLMARTQGISYEEALDQLERKIAAKIEKDEEEITKTEQEANGNDKPEEKEEEDEEVLKRRENAGKTGLQLQVTDGKLDIDTDSTIRQQNNAHDSTNRDVEETNPFVQPVISNTYSKRKQTDKWTAEEEYDFFRALSDWGTDFSIISDLFPHRTRKQVKAKFNNEERKRPGLIETALAQKFKPDLEQYKAISKTQLHTREDFEQSLAKIKAESDKKKRDILEERTKALQEDAERNRLDEIARRTGQRKPLEKLTKSKQLRHNEEVVGTIDRA